SGILVSAFELSPSIVLASTGNKDSVNWQCRFTNQFRLFVVIKDCNLQLFVIGRVANREAKLCVPVEMSAPIVQTLAWVKENEPFGSLAAPLVSLCSLALLSEANDAIWVLFADGLSVWEIFLRKRLKLFLHSEVG